MKACILSSKNVFGTVDTVGDGSQSTNVVFISLTVSLASSGGCNGCRSDIVLSTLDCMCSILKPSVATIEASASYLGLCMSLIL